MPKKISGLFYCLISAALLVLPFHFSALGWLAFFAFIPYLHALDRRSSSDAFTLSYVFGLAFFALLGYWLCFVSVLGFILTALYLALYFGAFGLLSLRFISPTHAYERLDTRRALRSAFYIPAIWVVLEVVRGWMIGGLPWALLGYSQWRDLPAIQIAELTGAWGVSYFVLLVNLLIYRMLELIGRRPDADALLTRLERNRALGRYALVLALTLALVFGYGALSLKTRTAFYDSPGAKAKLRVAVVQGNIPQDQKWNTKIKNIIFEKYKRLTLMAAMERSDLVIWPETSFPGVLEDEPMMAAQLRNLVRQSRTDVLVGAPTMGELEKGVKFYNSAMLYGTDGEERQRYNKVHLVPFGEYIPLEPLLGFIRNFFHIGHFEFGTEKTIFRARTRYQEPNIRYQFATLICFEDIFPSLVREFCKNGADVLVNMTNDAWFGKTSAPYQHAQASVFRAVENRVPVVRATNTGLSCFITAEGRILSTVNENGEEIFVTGQKSQELALRKGRSFYTRFGDVFLFVVLALCVMGYRDKTRQNI